MSPRRRTGPAMPPAPAKRWWGCGELCAGFIANNAPHVPGKDRIERQHALWALAKSGVVRYRAGIGVHLTEKATLPRWLADMQNGDLMVELPVDLQAANEILQAAGALARMEDADGPGIDWASGNPDKWGSF